MHERFPQLSLVAERSSQVSARFAHLRGRGNDLAQHRFGFAETSDVDQDRGEIAFRQRIVRRQREARAILALGVFEPEKLLQDTAQVVAGVDMPGIDRQRLDEAIHCVRRAFQVAQDIAAIEPDQGVVGVPARQSAQHTFGFGELVQHRQRIRHAHLQTNLSRIEAARLAECVPGFFVASEGKIGLRQIAQDLGAVAQRPGGALEALERLFGLPQLQQRSSQQVQGIRMIGRHVQCLLIGVLCGIELSLRVLAQAGFDMKAQKVLMRRHGGIMTGQFFPLALDPIRARH